MCSGRLTGEELSDAGGLKESRSSPAGSSMLSNFPDIEMFALAYILKKKKKKKESPTNCFLLKLCKRKRNAG